MPGRPAPRYSFAPRWRPPFVSALVPEDRCHLNGLAVVDGQPRYVTALAQTDSAEGWRAVKATGGCLMEVPSGHIVAARPGPAALAARGRGQALLSALGPRPAGRGRSLDRPSQPVAELPGVARGLALHGGFAFVGLSKARPTLEGVPIVAQRDQLKCGLAVVDLRTGRIAAHLEFRTGVEEIFDVQVLPGITFPYISGPGAERDTGQPLWTVPPA